MAACSAAKLLPEPQRGSVLKSEKALKYARARLALAPWSAYDASEKILQLDDVISTLAGGYRNPQCDYLSTLPLVF